jgi:hypothetical protein
MKKIAFVSENNFTGSYPRTFQNSRTDVSWPIALNANHHSFQDYKNIKNYDYVICILPKGECTVNSEGSKINLIQSKKLLSNIFSSNTLNVLKNNNKHICYMQEGPSWYFEDYELNDQINYINFISDCDIIFVHNEYDIKFYKGLFNKPIYVLPSLMIEDTVCNIPVINRTGCMIGGNCSRWYNGFNGYLLSLNFDCKLYMPSMHAKRIGENNLPNLQHIEYTNWTDWIFKLNERKYAIHLMPTAAAGTFSLNCAYLGIPCIGNKNLDTQNKCHPLLSVDVEDMETSKMLILKLKNDNHFYNECSVICKSMYEEHFKEEVFLKKMEKILC